MKQSYLILPVVLVVCGCTYVSTPVINQADLTEVNFAKLQDQKTNKSCYTLLLGFIPVEWKQSIAEAAWEAGITKVSYVEHTYSFAPFPGLPFLYSSNCINVYGE